MDRKTDLGELIESSLRHSIEKVLVTQTFDFDNFIRKVNKPVVIMFVGVNGTGKTTAIARIAHRLKKEHISCVLAARTCSGRVSRCIANAMARPINSTKIRVIVTSNRIILIAGANSSTSGMTVATDQPVIGIG